MDTTGDPMPGGTIAFRFPLGGFDMLVTDTVPGERVIWSLCSSLGLDRAVRRRRSAKPTKRAQILRAPVRSRSWPLRIGSRP